MACGGCLRREKGVSKTSRPMDCLILGVRVAGAKDHEQEADPLHAMVDVVCAFFDVILTHAALFAYAPNILAIT